MLLLAYKNDQIRHPYHFPMLNQGSLSKLNHKYWKVVIILVEGHLHLKVKVIWRLIIKLVSYQKSHFLSK